MIHMYCKAKHGLNNELCESCEQLVKYAISQYEKCPFGEIKPECSICPVHCYKVAEKEEIKKVMRYAGPRMIYKHPIMAVDHLIAKWKYPSAKALEKIHKSEVGSQESEEIISHISIYQCFFIPLWTFYSFCFGLRTSNFWRYLLYSIKFVVEPKILTSPASACGTSFGGQTRRPKI